MCAAASRCNGVADGRRGGLHLPAQMTPLIFRWYARKLYSRSRRCRDPPQGCLRWPREFERLGGFGPSRAHLHPRRRVGPARSCPCARLDELMLPADEPRHHHDHAHHRATLITTLRRGPPEPGLRAGIALNVGFVVIELVPGWLSGSLALLADAGHNLSDVAGLVLAWGAALAGGLRPHPPAHLRLDARLHPRRPRQRAVADLRDGVLAVEAVQRLQAPEPVAGWTVIVVAAIGVLVNGLTAMLFVAGRKADLNVRGAFLHMAGDALVSLGVVVAGLLYLQFGWGWLDPLVSLAIAVVIVLGTWACSASRCTWPSTVSRRASISSGYAWLLAQPGIVDVHDLHVWALGTSGRGPHRAIW